MNNGILKTIGIVFFIVLLLILAVIFIPWDTVNWGRIQIIPGSTVTVTGQAETQQKNQIASFTAGVDSVNDDKDKAVTEVNEKITVLTEAAKNFGIKPEDIQTQNISIYRSEETYYEGESQKSRPGQWRVNNSITLKLRDVSKTSELAKILTNSGATNIYGPNFALDDTKETERNLIQEAISDAQKKAQKIAESTNHTLGEVISVSEGSQDQTFYPLKSSIGAGGGADVSVEPGSGTVSVTVTVVYKLK